MNTIVNAVLLRDGAILLARRSPHRATYPGLWSFPGGHVEGKEALADALARELREEIGVVPLTYAHLATILDPSPQSSEHIAYHVYSITSWAGRSPSPEIVSVLPREPYPDTAPTTVAARYHAQRCAKCGAKVAALHIRAGRAWISHVPRFL